MNLTDEILDRQQARIARAQRLRVASLTAMRLGNRSQCAIMFTEHGADVRAALTWQERKTRHAHERLALSRRLLDMAFDLVGGGLR
jgi:glycerol kinase